MKRRNRSIWEANIWEANSYKSDVFKKPSISHAISSDHEGTTTDLPLFDPTTSRSQNIGHSNTATDCGHSTWPTSTATWPSESEHVSKSNVKHKIATASDLVPVEHQRAVGLVRTRKIGRQTRTIGERALQTEPDAHQGNVEVVGGHQRSHHRQLCLQHAAHSRVHHRRSELTGLEDRTQAPPARRRFVKQTQED